MRRRALCPQCNQLTTMLVGDGRHWCPQCRLKFSDQRARRAWRAVRLPEAIKVTLVERFARGIPARRVHRGPNATNKMRKRVARLCRAVCAIDVELEAPLVFERFRLRDAHGVEVPLIGITLTASDGRIRVRTFNANEPGAVDRTAVLTRPLVGTLQPVGRYRAHVWLRLRGQSVHGPEVSGRPTPPDAALALDQQLLHFGEAFARCVSNVPVIACRHLHLHVAEAIVRARYREFGDPELAIWLRSELEQRHIHELDAVLTAAKAKYVSTRAGDEVRSAPDIGK